MPFDVAVETPTIRRAILVAALRSDMGNWDWNFLIATNECGTAGCAIGLAATIWGRDKAGIGPNSGLDFTQISRFFGIDKYEAEQTFGSFAYGVGNASKVTPEMVARRLERLT